MTRLPDSSLDQIFMQAYTATSWANRDVPDALLQEAFEMARMGPTSANCQPMRIVFVRTSAAKEKLRETLSPGNVDKTMAAPVTAIIAYDLEFYKNFDRFFPHADARSWFEGNTPMIQDTAFRNSSLQGAYFIIALRSLGLDCGPMSGFDGAKVDAAFLGGTSWRSNFLINIGYGDPSARHPRLMRMDFAEGCRVV